MDWKPWIVQTLLHFKSWPPTPHGLPAILCSALWPEGHVAMFCNICKFLDLCFLVGLANGTREWKKNAKVLFSNLSLPESGLARLHQFWFWQGPYQFVKSVVQVNNETAIIENLFGWRQKKYFFSSLLNVYIESSLYLFVLLSFNIWLEIKGSR